MIEQDFRIFLVFCPFMYQALKQACQAYRAGKVPVGCVVVQNNRIIAQACNQKESSLPLPVPLQHAEIIAAALACQSLGQNRLDNCDLYVTLEPCPFCFSALSLLKIRRVFFGAFDPEKGVFSKTYPFSFVQHPIESLLNHKIEVVGGIAEEKCSALLTAFFKKLRKNKHSFSNKATTFLK